MEFRLVPLLLLLSVARSASSETNESSLLTCQNRCGDVNITYPFGIGAGCYLDAGFEIRCNYSFKTPKAFLGDGNIEVVNIFPGYVRARTGFISYECYNQTDWVDGVIFEFNLSRRPPFRFSNTRNKFTAIGCATLAYIDGKNGHDSYEYSSGCVSMCYSPGSATNGSCSGLGCCQTSIPEDLIYFNVTFADYDHSNVRKQDVWNFSPCSYGTLIEEESYNFTVSDLSNFDFYTNHNDTGFPTGLDWAIRDASCSDAKQSPNYACRSENSYCYNATNGPGYLCNCLGGYEGNPYLQDGCEDINECLFPDQYPCHGDCSNQPGGYNCTCKKGTQGNATAGTCSKIPDKFPLAAKLSVGISVMLALSFLLVIELQKRKYHKEKIEYFKLNGGQRLYDEMSRRQVDTFRFLTEQDLKKATNNFDKDRILGAGGRGEVYKGELEDGGVVAIKKSKKVDENQKDEFVNEIIILFRINHRSVVRLLGCCFEVPVPMLVYEFIPNGTLSDFLHVNTSAIPLHVRLEIAVDSADALAYLHSSTSRSVIHGDVKSLNILLDADYKAKVADFGASTLVPLDKDQLVELVQGTLGYLDPECISTQQLTDKSDVYSFGVVLLELITRKKAIYRDALSEKISLASSFDLVMSQNRLCDILDDQIVGEGAMEVLQEVAKLALHCLSRKREDRPTMNEVADKLKVLARFQHHPSGHKKPEEIQSLFGEMSRYSIASDTTTAYNSTRNRLVLNIDDGR